MNNDDRGMILEFKSFINNREFPCVAAKAALERQQVTCMVADHMACPKDDKAILQFLYNFIYSYRKAAAFFYSAAVIFKGPVLQSEGMFDSLLWQRLQSLSDLDAKSNNYDNRVDADPHSPNFSFSLKEEAFFIIGLNPVSSRPSRQFKFPALVFNPHAQFEQLRETNRYEKMKNIVRKRDVAYSGSVNPMLDDFGTSSEVFQYSGLKHDHSWQCPLMINHAKNEHHSSS
ncbi:MAG: guanitoxin biosynthesis heme-dependent pre-guanitoxin N-hydroxylase GntA [Chitinophagaceae bacterium]